MDNEIALTQVLLNGVVFAELTGYKGQFEVKVPESHGTLILQVTLLDQAGLALASDVVTLRLLRIDVQESTRLLLVPVMVKTRSNKAVTNLDADDFEVFEDGRPVGIETVSLEELPLELVLLFLNNP